MNEIVKLPTDVTPVRRQSAVSTFLDAAVFDQLWRGAQALARSQLVPASFRGKPEDCFLALHIAHRLGADPLLVLQNLYIVHGTAGWSAKFCIAQANLSGVFRGRIRFRTEGEGKTLKVTAYATLAETDEEVAETVTFAQAEAEQWTKNTKYKTLPELMLKYRAATFLVRLHAPEVMLGVPVVDEVEDVAAAAKPAPRPASGTAALRQALEAADEAPEEVVDTETGEVTVKREVGDENEELPF